MKTHGPKEVRGMTVEEEKGERVGEAVGVK